MTTEDLRSMVSDKINGRWSKWAQRHPHLAQVIDHTRLVESAVERLRDDPRFIRAMQEADLDDARLSAAAKILERADQVIRDTLPL